MSQQSPEQLEIGKVLTLQQKYTYERILKEANHTGSVKRSNKSLVILQKLINSSKNLYKEDGTELMMIENSPRKEITNPKKEKNHKLKKSHESRESMGSSNLRTKKKQHLMNFREISKSLLEHRRRDEEEINSNLPKIRNSQERSPKK